jgi:cytoskeleton protein RodZ
VPDGLGATLRKARDRRDVALSDVEAAIKIRARYLLAMENEEWDALPGGSYARGFIRTYATYLGLDGERLAGEFEPEPEPVAGNGPRARRRAPRPALTGAVVLALLAAAAAIGLATGGGGGGPAGSGGVESGSPPASGSGSSQAGSGEAPDTVSLRLATKAEVWVCVLDRRGRALVDGEVLSAGVEEGPFHSGSFTVAFGNGEVAMQVDGKETEIPASASPLGYAIHPGGRLVTLSEAERPTCL